MLEWGHRRRGGQPAGRLSLRPAPVLVFPAGGRHLLGFRRGTVAAGGAVFLALIPLRSVGPVRGRQKAGPVRRRREQVHTYGRRHVAVLRRAVHPGGSLPPPRQPAGIPGLAGGPPHLSHQHRAVPAVCAGRPGFGLHRRVRHAEPGGEHRRHGGKAGKMEGKPAQLVRHPHPAAPVAPVCLHRGQRQPGLLPGALRAGAAGS